MPNWCSNSITISGSTDTIKQLWDDAHVGDDFGLLNAMVPMPKELDDTTKGCLLYTSDAADDSLRVDLGGLRTTYKVCCFD
mgnify:CR=1 FL=1